MITVKYTGTTKYFEHYYGELIFKGGVITKYYYQPSRYCGVYKTREFFNNRQLAHRTITGLCKKMNNQIVKIK